MKPYDSQFSFAIQDDIHSCEKHKSPARLAECLERYARSPLFDYESGHQMDILLYAAQATSYPGMQQTVWDFFAQQAKAAHTSNDDGLKISLRIAFFECYCEWPFISEDVEKIFGLLDDPETRWVVFELHDYWPKSFKRHIELFGNGRISPDEYQTYLQDLGLVETANGLRYTSKRQPLTDAS
jgi:hypothetical protein